MTTTEKKSEIVSNGVDAQALLDKYLAKSYRAGMRYAQVIEEAVKNGFFVNPLEAKRMLAQARSLSGKIAEAAELAAELHLSGTQLAKDNDVDLGSVITVGGVDFVRRDTGMITPFGGGR